MNEEDNSNSNILDYRLPGTTRTKSSITLKGCATIVGILLVMAIIGTLMGWRHQVHLDREEMRGDLPPELRQFVDGAEARYEMNRVFTGSDSKYYRVKATPPIAQNLIAGFSMSAQITLGDVSAGTEIPMPEWWNPKQSQDIREFDCHMEPGRDGWIYEKYWISPSTGWVYLNVVGH